MRRFLLLTVGLTLASCGGASDENLYSEEYDTGKDMVYFEDESSSDQSTDAPSTIPDLTRLSAGDAPDVESSYTPVKIPEVYIPTADELIHGNPWPRLIETEKAIRVAERQILANEIASGIRRGGTFHGDDCTDDCSGHEAGYEWAADNGIENPDNCGGTSLSFEEGCRAYADEQFLDY